MFGPQRRSCSAEQSVGHRVKYKEISCIYPVDRVSVCVTAVPAPPFQRALTGQVCITAPLRFRTSRLLGVRCTAKATGARHADTGVDSRCFARNGRRHGRRCACLGPLSPAEAPVRHRLDMVLTGAWQRVADDETDGRRGNLKHVRHTTFHSASSGSPSSVRHFREVSGTRQACMAVRRAVRASGTRNERRGMAWAGVARYRGC